jgi:pimeloyl-ACP methyl ester carboxylesterase
MASSPAQTGYASVNGLKMYYEIHGSGRPLVVLHGAFMTIGAMGPLVPALAEDRQVIAVELQGHGHTADIDRQAMTCWPTTPGSPSPRSRGS